MLGQFEALCPNAAIFIVPLGDYRGTDAQLGDPANWQKYRDVQQLWGTSTATVMPLPHADDLHRDAQGQETQGQMLALLTAASLHGYAGEWCGTLLGSARFFYGSNDTQTDFTFSEPIDSLPPFENGPGGLEVTDANGDVLPSTTATPVDSTTIRLSHNTTAHRARIGYGVGGQYFDPAKYPRTSHPLVPWGLPVEPTEDIPILAEVNPCE
jgi:hypothetical protein